MCTTPLLVCKKSTSSHSLTHSLTHLLTVVARGGGGSKWERVGLHKRMVAKEEESGFVFPQKSSPESLKYQIIPQLEHRKKGKREELWAQGFSQKVAVTRNSTCNEVQPADYKMFFFDNHVDYFLVFVVVVLVTHTKKTFMSNPEPADYKIYVFDYHLDYFLVFLVEVLVTHTQNNFYVRPRAFCNEENPS